MSADHGVDLLGSLPLDIRIREQADSGNPTVSAMQDSQIGGIYRAIARKTAARLATKARDHSAAFPNIVIQNN
jgi:ATP-binding protein involved in chromosome partitioning